MHIDHIGIAVRSIEETEAKYFKLLGAKCFHFEEVPDQGVRVGFIQVGQQKLELLESLDDNGPIGKFIEKRGPGVHHIAYKVNDILAELERLEKEGMKLIDRAPRIGALGKWVAFVHPKAMDGVLVELCQSREESPDLV